MNSLTNNNILISSAVICVLTVITGGLIYSMIQKKRKRDYVKVAKVSKLIIYPIKSLPGIEVNQMEVTKTGLKFGPFKDRAWMLVDNQNRFITQRTENSLALLKISFNGNQLYIDGPNLPTLKLNVITERHNKDVIQTKVWGQPIEGIYCGEESENWFSKYLDKPGIKLIQHLQGFTTRSSGAEINDKVINLTKFPILFQDGSGVLLMNQNSINDLNERISAENKVTEKNYRPNILVTDCKPYEEDNWLYIKISSNEFTFLKPCERCVLTTINPQNGTKDPEALNTLRKYRLADQKMRKFYGTAPLFGVNFGPENCGQIYTDDDILAVRRIM